MAVCLIVLLPGSSPHTRGAHAQTFDSEHDVGIIPAYAGSTCEQDVQAIVAADHPRIRGEHLLPDNTSIYHCGSSPHTRGARIRRPRGRIARRIIPAYAGSTVDCVVVGFPEWDHPRIRGEHNLVEDAWVPVRGSSPHTRGALRHLSRRPDPLRIIPAYAGSTERAGGPPAAQVDHPRIRGEHSPPCGAPLPRRWIIPAYAGSTPSKP